MIEITLMDSKTIIKIEKGARVTHGNDFTVINDRGKNYLASFANSIIRYIKIKEN